MADNATPSPWGDLFGDSTTDAWDPGVAVLDDWAFSQWARAEGFRLAAELLIEATKKLDHLDSDRVVFPIVFLYRHAVELKLKELIAECNAFLGDGSEPPFSHDLVVLWRVAKGVVGQCPVGKTTPYVSIVETAVGQLQSVDDNAATSFRYARDRKGARPLPNDLTIIDPDRVGERLQEVIDILDGWIQGISVAADNRAEMETEYADYGLDDVPD